ncbi:hypothetical protein M2375_001562 [Comamonas sp. BIGb0152]|nr:hypothetical protein [Comamonas sp. BIGb0152]
MRPKLRDQHARIPSDQALSEGFFHGRNGLAVATCFVS